MRGMNLLLNTLIAIVGFYSMNYINSVDEKIDNNQNLTQTSLNKLETKIDALLERQYTNGLAITTNATDIENLRLIVADFKRVR